MDAILSIGIEIINIKNLNKSDLKAFYIFIKEIIAKNQI